MNKIHYFMLGDKFKYNLKEYPHINILLFYESQYLT